MPELKPQHYQAVLDALPAGVKVQMQLNPRRTYLAGGFIREIVLGNKPRDIDIFVPNEDEAKRLSAEYADEYPDKKFKPWKSDYAFNFTPDGEIPVQWVFAVRFDPQAGWGEHQYAVIDSFDFSMSKAVVWFEDEDWHTFCNDNFYETVEKHQLIFEPSSFDTGNLRALKRALKFAARGWTIDDEHLTQIIQRFAPEKTHDEIRGALYPMYGQKKQKQTITPSDSLEWHNPVALADWAIGTTTGRLSSNGLDLGEVHNVEIRALRPLNGSFLVSNNPSYEWRFVDNSGGLSVDIETTPSHNTSGAPTPTTDTTQGR